MKKVTQSFEYLQADDLQFLAPEDAALIVQARQGVQHAYAPYSNFRVAAVVKLDNGETITGTNQENASYPVGICAERTALSAASAVYPGVGIEAIAVSYQNEQGEVRCLFHPVAFAGKHCWSTSSGSKSRSVYCWADKLVRYGY
ncbi:hypothetical protein MKQ68_14690 [Chitinophaga horti]|uniref:CMP/dCMP-type deaminase domain-containing protein n=1 Tax=Chitinophaga horti TaxID=2920382 RepID=A0ABY6IVD9_9BACT|nr:hypothetical protein [Chitinophaga horti]UYQ91338.1 hypothetical protein MKQ68_14690 [Chitinophaga horti]